MIKELCEFMKISSSLYIYIQPILIATGIVVVDM